MLLGRHLQARVVVFPSESYYTSYMSVVRPESQLSRPLTGRGNGSYRDNYLTHSHLTVTEFEIFLLVLKSFEWRKSAFLSARDLLF